MQRHVASAAASMQRHAACMFARFANLQPRGRGYYQQHIVVCDSSLLWSQKFLRCSSLKAHARAFEGPRRPNARQICGARGRLREAGAGLRYHASGMTDLLPGIATETLQCFAGHEWVRPFSRGGKPTACPEHIRYLNEPISARLKPPRRVTEVWEETAVVDEPPVYVRRWTKAWERAVRIVAAQHGTFTAVDVDKVEEYVRHKRLAELHRAYAEFDPYQTTNAGSVKPHPGWYQAQVEETFAQRTARDLGLTPDPSAQAGSGPEDDWQDGVYDDQIGPDGKQL